MLLKEVQLFKNHSGVIGDWVIRAEEGTAGEAFLVIAHTKVLGGKAVEKRQAIAGKNIGRSNETTPSQQAVLELDSRVNKQLDKGYVRTQAEAIAPATNSLGLEKPMLAHPIADIDPAKIDWDNAFAQPKLDGHRCLFKNGTLYSRNGKVINLPHIVMAIEAAGLSHLHLDGELYLHGTLLQDIGSLVKKPRAESLELRYHLYDVVMDAPYRERFQTLVGAMPLEPASLKLVPAMPVYSTAELDKVHQAHLTLQYEGTILRQGLLPYQDGKRSWQLLKVKDFSDGEFIVIGCEPGTPNGDLQVPVWTLANPDGITDAAKKFKATAHGTAEQKHAQWEMRGFHMGRPLTVQFFGRSKDGVPLLPVSLRWKEDV
jgi:DNA ligase-1